MTVCWIIYICKQLHVFIREAQIRKEKIQLTKIQCLLDQKTGQAWIALMISATVYVAPVIKTHKAVAVALVAPKNTQK